MTIIAVALLYIGILFAIAYYGDKRADAGRSIVSNPYVYALSLAVYCTDWTFYGSVGLAANAGLEFLPIYLGPTLIAALWLIILRKIIRISKTHRITSIADFIASRYGKSTHLGGLVTIIAVIGIVPYISLQLKAVWTTINILWSAPDVVMPHHLGTIFIDDTSFYVAVLLAVFAILFGTRHLDATEHHEGLVAAIAFESVVKLLAFLAAGLFVTYGIYNGFSDIFNQGANLPQIEPLFNGEATAAYSSWLGFTVLSMMAVMFLPRQFQVAVVENTDESHLTKAVWLFPLYLFVINIFVIPIAIAGLLQFPGGQVDADTFVLTIPIAHGEMALALFVFLGGLSAAMSMVIVETVALSTMVSNDLVMPLLLRWQSKKLAHQADLSRLLLFIRRGAIIIIILLSYIYFRLTGESRQLVSIGLVSFAAVAQFAPAILGGIYWKQGTRQGALVGLIAGFGVWVYTLFIPSLVESHLIEWHWLATSFIEDGLFGLHYLKPYALFGLEGLNPIIHALIWSLLVNVGCYVGLSLTGQQSALEHTQATRFVDIYHQTSTSDSFSIWRGTASMSDLETLLGRFLGQERAHTALTNYAQQNNLNWTELSVADKRLVDFAEQLLAGNIGAASARIMITSIINEEELSLEEVLHMLDETREVIAYSQALERKSRDLEAATTELRTANERLQKLDQLKDEFMSTITHELRTPLTSIRAFAEILSDNPELELAQRAQFSGIILKESERLTRLINQVLDLSKIEAGKMEWNSAEIDLIAVLEESLQATKQLFKEKNIDLEVKLPATVRPVIADHDRLVQVMLNLLSNAIKFCHPEQGHIMVQLTPNTTGVQVDVQDNGVGIAPEDQEMIFDKFRQGGNVLTDKPQGTGLGLPISRQIITHFNGKLWVTSTPPDGATFSFYLPYN